MKHAYNQGTSKKEPCKRVIKLDNAKIRTSKLYLFIYIYIYIWVILSTVCCWIVTDRTYFPTDPVFWRGCRGCRGCVPFLYCLYLILWYSYLFIYIYFVWPDLRKHNSNIGAAASSRRTYKRGAAASSRRPPFIGSYIGFLLSQMRSDKIYKYK